MADPIPGPVTYNNDQIAEKGRELFMMCARRVENVMKNMQLTEDESNALESYASVMSVSLSAMELGED